jgi:hypothetical protein
VPVDRQTQPRHLVFIKITVFLSRVTHIN